MTGRTVALAGTFDTKAEEYRYVVRCLEQFGLGVLTIDVGILGSSGLEADVPREEVARAAGARLAELAGAHDRGVAVSTMATGLERVVGELHREGRIHGILGLGGTGGTTLIARAMRSLPIGFPKLIVSTVASGDTRPYVGDRDLTMMNSVVDIAGVNRVSGLVLANAAGAIAGMVQVESSEFRSGNGVIAATMFGVTTPAVNVARSVLEQNSYEVLVFHATGAGGASMESLVREGLVDGVLDLTTTELADELVGGVFSAGPERLLAAAREGVPQVVSLGALDMVNFGPRDTVPAEFRDRVLYQHNDSVTLMRTTVEECRELGRRVAARLNEARGPATLMIPLRGVSSISTQGEPFWSPDADAALVGAIRETLDPDRVELIELDLSINEPAFAEEAAARLMAHIDGTKEGRK